MKKTIFILATFFSVAVLFTACKDTKKVETEVESHEGHDHGTDEMAAGDVYQCPMDCEKGKTYAEEGSCPICKMDLKPTQADSEKMHSENCTCKKGGECTCEGECQCQEEEASTAMNHAKCSQGSCECRG